MVRGHVRGEHDVDGDGVGLRDFLPLGVTVLLLKPNQLERYLVRTGHDQPTRVPIQEGFPKHSHFISDGGGVGLGGAHASVITKGLLKVPSRLPITERYFDRHGSVSIVERILTIPVVNVVF